MCQSEWAPAAVMTLCIFFMFFLFFGKMMNNGIKLAWTVMTHEVNLERDERLTILIWIHFIDNRVVARSTNSYISLVLVGLWQWRKMNMDYTTKLTSNICYSRFKYEPCYCKLRDTQANLIHSLILYEHCISFGKCVVWFNKCLKSIPSRERVTLFWPVFGLVQVCPKRAKQMVQIGTTHLRQNLSWT